MRATCSRLPIAYVEERTASSAVDLNLVSSVTLIERQHPGGDGTPILVDSGCGRDFEVSDSRAGWDVNLDADGRVVERHSALMCPYCGRIADHLSEPVAAVPVGEYVTGIRDEFLAQVVGDDLLAATPNEVRAMLWAGLPATNAERLFVRGVDEHGIPRIGQLPSGGADVGYAHVTEGAVALAAATAKTVIGAKAGSAAGLSWTYFNLAFDGVTASAIPVTVELCRCTFGANSPGTNSTGTTEQQEYGRVLAADWTGGRNWTTEPTTISVLGEGLLTPNGGLVMYDDPLGTEPDCALGEGFAIRLTAPAVVNVRGGQKLKRV
jgi:hypothetical protein